MLLLGGAATVQALTGVNYMLAAFLIPWGVILYTSTGGLKATFMASYLHTVIIFAVLITMITLVYIKIYSSDQIYSFLANTVSYTEEQCMASSLPRVPWKQHSSTPDQRMTLAQRLVLLSMPADRSLATVKDHTLPSFLEMD
jgi:Na+/proline symporter